MVKDSIKVFFSIPYQRSDLDISVSSNTFKTFGLNYFNNKELIMHCKCSKPFPP